ncbi:MAG TPA: radical SAM family heme chaperone HemW [Bryobacteraceae bacterium]|nr:radical SAM family heme chaperone HemW [Bryobacteraceae bacterium]
MAGVYISWPFCAQKCTFCNFASGVFPRPIAEQYGLALLDEIRRHEWGWTPETVYLGGGTPSLIEHGLLRRLLDGVPGRPWAEATIEAAPGSFSAEKVAAWRDAGIDRISLGVQSFVRRELAQTGRRHDAAAVAADMELLRGHGIENINIDLIAGLAHQTPQSWSESLDWIERLAPPHVSVYIFEIDEDSRLGGELLAGGALYGASEVPPADMVADLYEHAVERLAAMGIARYEISNFARPGAESRHNLKYWLLEPYAGFGADAHSFDGRERHANVETAGEYIVRWSSGDSPRRETTRAILSEERFLAGLRLMRGIEPADAEWRQFDEPIRRFLADGLLEREDRRLRLSSRGVLLSNEILQEFLHA